MEFIKKLTIQNLTNFIEQTLNAKVKVIKIEIKNDKIYGKLKLVNCAESLRFVATDYSFGMTQINSFNLSILYPSNIVSYEDRCCYLNKQYKIFMFKLFGKDYKNTLLNFMSKSAQVDCILYKQRINLIERKFSEREELIQKSIEELQAKKEKLIQDKETELAQAKNNFNNLKQEQKELLKAIKAIELEK